VAVSSRNAAESLPNILMAAGADRIGLSGRTDLLHKMMIVVMWPVLTADISFQVTNMCGTLTTIFPEILSLIIAG